MVIHRHFKILLSIIIVIVISCNFLTLSANNNFLGDLNGDSRLNAIDITILTGILIKDGVYSEIADMNIDDEISLKDLVRMKKYLVGEVLNVNTSTEGFSWVLLDGDEYSVVTGIGYMFYTNCYTKTVYFPGRTVWETSAYISTDKYANPEWPVPDMVVSSTSINGESVTMRTHNNIIVPENRIWDSWISYEEFIVPNRSTCVNKFSIMLKESPYAFREMKNEFVF